MTVKINLTKQYLEPFNSAQIKLFMFDSNT